MTTAITDVNWSLLTNKEIAEHFCRISGCDMQGAEYVVRTWVERGWHMEKHCYPAIRSCVLRRRARGKPNVSHLAYFTKVIEAWPRD